MYVHKSFQLAWLVSIARFFFFSFPRVTRSNELGFCSSFIDTGTSWKTSASKSGRAWNYTLLQFPQTISVLMTNRQKNQRQGTLLSSAIFRERSTSIIPVCWRVSRVEARHTCESFLPRGRDDSSDFRKLKPEAAPNFFIPLSFELTTLVFQACTIVNRRDDYQQVVNRLRIFTYLWEI